MCMIMVVDQRGVLYVYVCIYSVILAVVANVVCGANDLKILKEFRDGLDNPELLKWPSGDDEPCGTPVWPHIVCSNGRVTQIQVQSLGLSGPLPQDINKLDRLESLGLQKNHLYGKLPTLSGLSNLQSVFLDGNQFDLIPANFFHGLTSIRFLAMDDNPLNKTNGWSIPSDLQRSSQLTNFSCSNCNIVGPLPGYFGELPSLTALKLSDNRLSGTIHNNFRNSMLQILWLNNQDGGGMTGPIDVIGSMVGLVSLWLHGNRFSGPIPSKIGNLTSLKDLSLNENQLVGLIPQGLAYLNLQSLKLDSNMLMGPIPRFRAAKVTYTSNSFCQQEPGEPCAPQVNSLLNFLHYLNYPPRLAAEWIGNNPCNGRWWGITCNPTGKVSIINLPKLNLDGTLSPSLASLNSLVEIHLPGNHLHGRVPNRLTSLRSLRLLDISWNRFDPPLPNFNKGVKVVTNGNPGLSANGTVSSPPSPDTDLQNPELPRDGSSPDYDQLPFLQSPAPSPVNTSGSTTRSTVGITVAATIATTIIVYLSVTFICYICKRKKSNDIYGETEFYPKEGKDQPKHEIKITITDESTIEPLGSHVTGKITTKVDVFSFGVVLMELLTGLTTLDENRPEESRYLVEWFWLMKSNKEKLIAAIDPALNAKEDIHNSICIIAELAGHCTAREPNRRPEMGHAVSVLAQLIETWKPEEREEDSSSANDFSLPLSEMLKNWQNERTGDFSYISQDSKESIISPEPADFPDSFSSSDAQ
nr:receptor-like kinase TMK3 [Ipomoea batatas]